MPCYRGHSSQPEYHVSARVGALTPRPEDVYSFTDQGSAAGGGPETPIDTPPIDTPVSRGREPIYSRARSASSRRVSYYGNGSPRESWSHHIWNDGHSSSPRSRSRHRNPTPAAKKLTYPLQQPVQPMHYECFTNPKKLVAPIGVTPLKTCSPLVPQHTPRPAADLVSLVDLSAEAFERDDFLSDCRADPKHLNRPQDTTTCFDRPEFKFDITVNSPDRVLSTLCMGDGSVPADNPPVVAIAGNPSMVMSAANQNPAGPVTYVPSKFNYTQSFPFNSPPVFNSPMVSFNSAASDALVYIPPAAYRAPTKPIMAAGDNDRTVLNKSKIVERSTSYGGFGGASESSIIERSRSEESRTCGDVIQKSRSTIIHCSSKSPTEVRDSRITDISSSTVRCNGDGGTYRCNGDGGTDGLVQYPSSEDDDDCTITPG